MKILIALNTAWNLVNFRAGIIREFIDLGHEVVGVAPVDDYVSDFRRLGGRHVSISMDNQGTNPVNDLKLFIDYLRLFRHEKPDVILTYTVKPNVYASLAAHLSGIPVINNVAGMGTVFNSSGILMRIVKSLYTVALSRSSKVFFQNEEDLRVFVNDGLVRKETTDILPGSGVDLSKFQYTPVNGKGTIAFSFLLVARMLWEKGIGIYIDAARIVKRSYPEVEFRLLGFLDVKNPSAISREVVDTWVAEGIVNYLGVSRDVRGEIGAARCVVLPSYYREGTPRTLIEAAALGRPIITTDTTGCRNVVEDGRNGFLCKPKDISDLAGVMIRMIRIGDEARRAMGEYGRKKMEREYDEQLVIGKYVQAVGMAVKAKRTNR